MEFHQISSAEDFRALKIHEAYCSTFPVDERRNENQFQQLFSNKKALVFSLVNGIDNIGYLIGWDMSHFIFVEHFEVFPQYRNQKFGSEILKELYRKYSKIILESEPENLNEIAKRRINFYQKNGFTTLKEDYFQPSYENGKNPVQLWLLGNFQPENLDRIQEEIYDIVYCL